MKKTILILIAVLLVFSAVFFVFILPKESVRKIEESKSGQELIGGQTDEHNCLVAAGYSWCEAKQTCLRVWEQSCDDSILDLVDQLENMTGVSFVNQGGTEFDWRVESETGVEILKLFGLRFLKSGATTEEYNQLARYLEDNLESDMQNAAGGVRGGLEGFISNYDVCLLTYEFTRSEQSPEGPIIPDTSSREVVLTCGWLDKNLLPKISDEKQIQKIFAEKYNKKIPSIDVSITQQIDGYARGSVKFWDETRSYGEGGIWLAYQSGNTWQLAFDGNGMFSCQTMQNYGFPPEMTEGCYDE